MQIKLRDITNNEAKLKCGPIMAESGVQSEDQLQSPNRNEHFEKSKNECKIQSDVSEEVIRSDKAHVNKHSGDCSDNLSKQSKTLSILNDCQSSGSITEVDVSMATESKVTTAMKFNDQIQHSQTKEVIPRLPQLVGNKSDYQLL